MPGREAGRPVSDSHSSAGSQTFTHRWAEPVPCLGRRLLQTHADTRRRADRRKRPRVRQRQEGKWWAESLMWRSGISQFELRSSGTDRYDCCWTDSISQSLCLTLPVLKPVVITSEIYFRWTIPTRSAAVSEKITLVMFYFVKLLQFDRGEILP